METTITRSIRVIRYISRIGAVLGLQILLGAQGLLLFSRSWDSQPLGHNYFPQGLLQLCRGRKDEKDFIPYTGPTIGVLKKQKSSLLRCLHKR